MANPTAVMQVEGVLRKPVTGAVIDNGRRLYLGLAQFYRLVLVSEGDDKRNMDTWLSMEGFVRHDHIVYAGGSSFRAPNWWTTVARDLKIQYGYNTELYVVPDPRHATALIQAGHNALLFTMAAYALPEWMPDHKQGVRPWADLSAEVARHAQLRAADNRMDDDHLRN